MMDKEERILRQNAEEVNRNAESFQELKIYNAMRGGIMQGKKREKRHKYIYGFSGLVAAAALLFIFSFGQSPVSNVAENLAQQPYTPTTKSWTDSELFMKSSSNDKSFKTILERNLIQPVYQSVENKGIRVEVMGAATDGRRVYLLSSVQNHTDKEITHADFTIDFGTFEAASIGGSLEITGGSSGIAAGQTSYFIYTNNLSPTVTYPKTVKWSVILTETSDQALSSSSSKYRTKVDVPFELDTGMFRDQTRTLYPESNLIVDGQTIKVLQVVNTPLSTYVDLEFDKNNEKQISSLIEPVLIGTSGDQTGKSYYPDLITDYNSEIYTDNSKVTLKFNNKLKEPLDEAVLKTFGIAALDKEQQKLIVDLSNNQIIAAPADDLTMVPSDWDPEPGKMLFHQTIDRSSLIDDFAMRLSDTFIDAKGQTHKADTENGLSAAMSGGKDAYYDYLYNFGKDASHYPQPLTLTIERYWYPILDTQSVKLVPKK